MLRKLIDSIMHSQPVQLVIRLLKQFHLPKSQVSLYTLILLFISELRDEHLIERANNVAFSFTLAIFPSIIFLFTLIPYIPIDNLQGQILDLLHQVMPEMVFQQASSTIVDIISKPRGGLLSVGFFMALIFATNGTWAMMKAFNRTYKMVEKRGFIKSRLIATGLTFMLAFVLVLAIALLIIGQQIIYWLMNVGILKGDFIYYLILGLRLVVIFVVFQLATSCIYYFGPAVKDRWHFFNPGSVVATLLSLAVSFGFSYYINNFGTYNKLYGSIGALIAIMIWFSFLSIFLMVGLEINVSLDKAKRLRRHEKI